MKKANHRANAAGDSAVDLKELQRLTAFMLEHGLEELEYQRGDVHIRLRKPFQVGASNSGPALLHGVPASPATAVAPLAAEAPKEAAPKAEELHTVKSPIVGTFYTAPTPGAEPFVKPGDQVETGQVLCIIEAMKLMNEIEADRAGEIVRRLVENGQPVEYGQPLFSLRPA